MYLTFIRPVLEYASEVWDNCGQINSGKLEKKATWSCAYCYGLPSFASINYIYNDLEINAVLWTATYLNQM